MERLLRDAGIGENMRVLDVGCGYGAVTQMIARLVGAGGQVVGLDRDPGALAMARTRALEAGHSNVSFVEAELHAPPIDAPFDAVVGRRVLMYVKDVDAAMRALVSVVRPGGIVVFQELDASMTPAASASLPLHTLVHRWIWDTVKHEGANPKMGLELASCFTRAGLVVEHVRVDGIAQAQGMLNATPGIVRGILPRILAAGAATEREVDVDSLEERMTKELEQKQATFVGDVYFGAWARKPSQARG